MESCPLALTSRRFIRKTRIGIEWEPSSREIESGNGIGERRVRDGGRSVIDIDNEAVVVVLALMHWQHAFMRTRVSPAFLPHPRVNSHQQLKL